MLFVERLHRRNQQAEVEVQLLAGRHFSRPGVGPHHDLLALLVDVAAAAAAVAPVLVQAALLEIVEVPAIFDVFQLAVDPGVDVADPELVVRAVDVPFPLPLRRAAAALAAQAHHVRGHLAPQGDFQADILQLRGTRGAERQAEVHVAVALHLRAAEHLHAVGLAGRLPRPPRRWFGRRPWACRWSRAAGRRRSPRRTSSLRREFPAAARRRCPPNSRTCSGCCRTARRRQRARGGPRRLPSGRQSPRACRAERPRRRGRSSSRASGDGHAATNRRRRRRPAPCRSRSAKACTVESGMPFAAIVTEP